ncbi:MAG: helix-hairpin-helix domain-containing protein [Parasporobacterium sp.]|nr:helix-hairpin-helix domain-containing protein [Parasporobacterium sp.]
MNKRIFKLLPALITIIVAGVVFCCVQEKQTGIVITEEFSGPEEIPAEKTSESGQDIWVYVWGCVKHPGVYRLETGARVFEAVEMAGGMTEDAGEGILNLAQELEDGQQICVPSEAQIDSEKNRLQEADDGRININTATEAELMSLPGIGKVKAGSIIRYREETPFLVIEDIMNVQGIKEEAFRKIRDLIKV